MAQFGFTADVATLPTNNNNFDPLPAGWYEVKIHSADLKATKEGGGQYIAVRYDVTGPTHEGRVVFGNLNVRNANPKAEEIGRAQLGELMRAIGIATANDTDELVGGTLAIKLDVKKDEKYGERNEVRGFRALDGAAPPAVSKNEGAAKKKLPWQK